MSAAATPEPKPWPNGHPAVIELVKIDLEARSAMGLQKYGTLLQPFNGRNSLWDAYQEALDLCMYLRQKIYEEDDK